MVVVVGVTEERAELATVALDAASSADLERGGVKINADFVFRPVPLITKAFDLIEVARDNMSDLAGWQFAFYCCEGRTSKSGLRCRETVRAENRRRWP